MDTCPYYHQHGSKPNTTPCCNHKHSPVPCFPGDAVSEPHALGCGGLVSRCEIPVEQQLDVS